VSDYQCTSQRWMLCCYRRCSSLATRIPPNRGSRGNSDRGSLKGKKGGRWKGRMGGWEDGRIWHSGQSGCLCSWLQGWIDDDDDGGGGDGDGDGWRKEEEKGWRAGRHIVVKGETCFNKRNCGCLVRRCWPSRGRQPPVYCVWVVWVAMGGTLVQMTPTYPTCFPARTGISGAH